MTLSRAQRMAMSRPAAGGIHLVSTGLAERAAIQQRLYRTTHAHEVEAQWWSTLSQLPSARVALLGVPSDAGAGFTRGANRAPAALRAHLLEDAEHPLWRPWVCDLGDVFTVPHFLSDDMLSPAQKEAAQRALYGEVFEPAWPVSPLDICQTLLDDAYRQNPDIVPIVIGGDHSVGWPAFAAAHAHWEGHRGRRIGLLHFDAHTDLLPERLGVQYCFATWAWHANERLGRDGRLVQVGIRASGRTQQHWEQSLGVRQYWAQTANALGAQAIADEIIGRWRALDVDALYISNDIDGTDPQWASATGTPEPGGLHPDFVLDLVQIVAAAFPLVGADLVEVAPPLVGHQPGEPKRTLDTAGRYLGQCIDLAQ
ncbi:MAG: arginase family protein [Myxococcota bacterium]|nr:arginase family protein [Myxococcota bacterium]